MQPDDGCTGYQYLSEQLELWSECVRDCDLLEGVLEEVAQQCSKCWCESVVEARASNSLVGSCGVSALRPGDSAGFAVDGEAHN